MRENASASSDRHAILASRQRMLADGDGVISRCLRVGSHRRRRKPVRGRIRPGGQGAGAGRAVIRAIPARRAAVVHAVVLRMRGARRDRRRDRQRTGRDPHRAGLAACRRRNRDANSRPARAALGRSRH